MCPRARTQSWALLFVLLVVAVYADPLFARKNFGGRDVLGGLLPMEFAIHDAYARGRLPVWVSEISGGRPLLANPNTSALYPARALLAVLPFPLAMRLFPVMHWALAGLGVMALLSALKVWRPGAWIGAVTYVFSGVVVSEVFYTNHIPGVTLFPWILWALVRDWRTRAGQVLTLSVLFGLDFLAGEVFTIGMAIAASVLWIAVEVEAARRLRLALRLAASFGLAFLIGLPQILATYLWIPETDRAVRGVLIRDAVAFSVSPWRLFELVVPYPFGTTWKIDPAELWAYTVFHGKGVGLFATLYAGALAVIALAAVRWRGKSAPATARPAGSRPGGMASAAAVRRPAGARFARFLLAGSLALAVLPSLLPAAMGDMASPVALRSPEKFGVAIVLAFALSTGIAFESLCRAGARLRWTLWVGGALAFLTLFAALFPGATASIVTLATDASAASAGRAANTLPPALAEGGLLWMATVVALDLLGKGARASFAAGLALVTLVPVLANRKIAQTYGEEALLGATPIARYVRRADPEGAYRVLGEVGYQASEQDKREFETDFGGNESFRRNWMYFTQALWKRGAVFNNDFDSGNLSRAESLRRVTFVEGFWDSPAFFGSLALRWGVRYQDQLPLPGYRPFRGNAVQAWDELDRAYPDIRLVERWREEPGATQALELVPRLKDGEIVIESGRSGEGSARPGSLRVLERSPERLTLETETLDPSWLFVLRGYWSYRTVTVDGRPAACLPAQLAFSAVPVPAGRHRIEWRERVPGAAISRWGPALFLLAAFGIVIAEPRRREPSRERLPGV
jgi:hypothetical protein